MTEPVLTFLGAVLGAVLTYLGVRFTARQSRGATDAATTVEAKRQAADEWAALTDRLAGQADRLAGQADRLEKRVATLEEERENDRGRIESLERKVTSIDRAYRAAIRYIRELRLWIAAQVPGMVPPPPPADLRVDLDA